MKNHNLILLADAYKYSHHKLYLPGTQHIYSYLESRGGKFSSTVFYGLQYFLKQYFEGVVITQEDINEAKELMPQVFGRDDVFSADKFQYIVDVHGGKLPIKIKAVKEGSVVPTHNVLLTIENTDPNCYWLTNFLETILMQIWYPNTVATLSFEIRKLLYKYYSETANDESLAGIDFVLNDFGFRGVSSLESAGIGGSAHLLSFDGSDTIAASTFARKFYKSNEMAGKSIPATEHSIMTLLGKKGEIDMMKHVLNTFPSGILACVSDSYNIFEACENLWGNELKQQIEDRDGVLVIRPDSGDPVATLLKVFEILFDRFGYNINAKGFKVLPSKIRVIQGDGVNYDSIAEILEALKQNGISAENLVLGMGGALLQKIDRDTQKFAIKCSYAQINGKDIEVAKSPTEMDALGNLHESFKKSKAGKLKLIKTKNGYETVKQHEMPEYEDELITVFENGEVLVEYQFEELKQNLRSQVNRERILELN